MVFLHFFHNFRSFKVLYVRRSGNRPTHLLAKYAQGVEQYVSWIEESPYFIKHALSNFSVFLMKVQYLLY